MHDLRKKDLADAQESLSLVVNNLSGDIETTKVHSYAYAQSLVSKAETKFNESMEESEKELN